MNESRPVVVHPADAIAGSATPGLELRHQLDPDGRRVGWSGWIRNEAGDIAGWHHHAANDTYADVIRESVSVEFGPGGGDTIEPRAGDLFFVPAQAIHREMTGSDEDPEAFVMHVGGEPEQLTWMARKEQ